MRRYLSLYLPVEDLKLLRKVGLWCLRFTPFVGVEEDLRKDHLEASKLRRGLILDITGMSLLYPSEEDLAQIILAKLKKEKIKVKIGIAPTLGSAWAVSRFKEGQIFIIKNSAYKNVLAELPLKALRLLDQEIESMTEVGISKIGELLNITPKKIGFRFGLKVLKRLDQMLGRLEEPMRLLKISEQLSISKKFEIPFVRKECLSKYALILLEELNKKVILKSYKACSYQLKFITEGHEVITRNISFHSASDNISHITSIVQSNIENLKFPQGVIYIKITALDLRINIPSQVSLTDNKINESYNIEKSLGEFLNTLAARIGKESIKKAGFCESYIPEKSFRFTALGNTKIKEDPKEYSSCMLGRPSTLLNQPEAIKVIAMLPDQPPSWINWRGESLRTLQGFGPERIQSEWWMTSLDEADLYRDYFRIQDELGRWLWVYREAKTLNWFLHGIWT